MEGESWKQQSGSRAASKKGKEQMRKKVETHRVELLSEICPEGTHEARTVEVQLKNLGLSGSKLDGGEKVEARTPPEIGTEGESRTFKEQQSEVLSCCLTQQLPKYIAEKVDISDGGGDEAHAEMYRGIPLAAVSKRFQMAKDYPKLSSLQSYSPADDDDGADGTSGDQDKEDLEMNKVKFIMVEQAMGLETHDKETQQLPKDMANKLDRLDGGGNEEEDEMGRGKPATEEQLAKDDPTSQQYKQLASYHANGIIGDLDEELVELERYKILFEKLAMIGPAHTTHPHGEEEVMATHGDSSAMKEMATEEECFTSHKNYWESILRSNINMHHFEDMTTLSPMHYTYLTPRRAQMSDGIVDTTLQIFSIKLAEVKGGFKWPLSVYGVVAARDDVDYKRNLLFSCERYRSQTIKEEDPFLRLIGPSRAIMFRHPVDFEIQLKVKDDDGGDEDEDEHGDRVLIRSSYHYSRVDDRGVRSIYIENCFCRAELCLEEVRGSVQATIFGLRVANRRSWCFRNGCRVACSSPSRSLRIDDGKATYITNAPSEVVLLDSRHLAMRHDADSEGYLDLSRHVVSVDLHGSLRVRMLAYSSSGDIAKQGHLTFTPQTCNVSQATFYVGDIEMEISVAWSLLVRDKGGIEKKGWVRGTY